MTDTTTTTETDDLDIEAQMVSEVSTMIRAIEEEAIREFVLARTRLPGFMWTENSGDLLSQTWTVTVADVLPDPAPARYRDFRHGVLNSTAWYGRRPHRGNRPHAVPSGGGGTIPEPVIIVTVCDGDVDEAHVVDTRENAIYFKRGLIAGWLHTHAHWAAYVEGETVDDITSDAAGYKTAVAIRAAFTAKRAELS